LPDAAWINKPKDEFNNTAIANNKSFQGVVEHGRETDRLSWDSIENNFLSPATKTEEKTLNSK
jgi:hypothetical protein